MSEPSQTERVEVDESTEESNIFVVDPDDYQKTRKLKAINDAKSHVQKCVQDMPATASQNEWNGIHTRTAEAVAMYGSELLPLIEDALEVGILEEDDLETRYGSLREFVRYNGTVINEDGKLADREQTIYMAFYRQLDRIQRKLGLGLELEEDKGPASI